jgi:putative transposase
MRKTFKYRIYPTKETERNLFWTLARCRELYNAALSERKDAYKYAGKSVTYYDQQNDLPSIKAEIRQEYQDIAAHVLQDVLRRLDKAFQNFFRRCRNGENPGYPRFQGRNRYDSFTYPDGAGWKLTRAEQGKKLKGTEKLPTSYEDVGIDLGVTHLATLSNGEMIEHPRYYRKAQKILEQRHQALSRKKRGSHRRDKARKAVAKAHRKIACQRKDFQQKAAKKLVERWHSCDCGTELDRDVNAAINILERGRCQQGAISVAAPCL